jgi:hypothetical protein
MMLVYPSYETYYVPNSRSLRIEHSAAGGQIKELILQIIFQYIDKVGTIHNDCQMVEAYFLHKYLIYIHQPLWTLGLRLLCLLWHCLYFSVYAPDVRTAGLTFSFWAASILALSSYKLLESSILLGIMYIPDEIVAFSRHLSLTPHHLQIETRVSFILKASVQYT